MADTYSLNPSIFPQREIPKDHHRKVVASVIVAGVAILVGVLYWWVTAQQGEVVIPATNTPPAPSNQQSLDILKGAPASVSQQDINTTLSTIKKNPVTVTASDKQKALDQLKAGN